MAKIVEKFLLINADGQFYQYPDRWVNEYPDAYKFTSLKVAMETCIAHGGHRVALDDADGEYPTRYLCEVRQ